MKLAAIAAASEEAAVVVEGAIVVVEEGIVVVSGKTVAVVASVAVVAHAARNRPTAPMVAMSRRGRAMAAGRLPDAVKPVGVTVLPPWDLYV
jgi:hypothetical protein